MKQTTLLFLLTLVLAGCKADTKTPDKEPPETQKQVRQEIATLREVIIPSKGTAKSEIEAVFGEGKVIEEPNGKGARYKYPMHKYQLLPKKKGQQFRSFLCVTYREKNARFVGINHSCVVKGRPVGKPAAEEIAREKRRVLNNLTEIKKKYSSELNKASWNK